MNLYEETTCTTRTQLQPLQSQMAQESGEDRAEVLPQVSVPVLEQGACAMTICTHEPKIPLGVCRPCYGRMWRESRKPKFDPRPMLTCLRCGNVWRQKFFDRTPRFCQKCKTPLWNTLRKVAAPGEPEKTLRRLNKIKTNECVEWPHGKTFGGYGHVHIKGLSERAHVASWEITHGRRVRKGIEVRHKCDNPPCINPRHLILGTHKHNMRDSVERKRHAFGVRNGHAKLSDDKVREIRNEKVLSFPEQAEKYGVSVGSIYHVHKRDTWRHVE